MAQTSSVFTHSLSHGVILNGMIYSQTTHQLFNKLQSYEVL